MQEVVYVDVLLVLNYLVTLVLLVCTAKLSGRRPKRRRIVAAALFGSLCSLTIFLPQPGIVLSISTKLLMSGVIAFLAFGFISARQFLWELLLFFLCSFFFAGAMLGLWLVLKPSGMTYNNGVVYFSISPVTLILSTAAAYLLLTLGARLRGRSKLAQEETVRVAIGLCGGDIELTGFVDTGNSLRDPFSDTPVCVCRLDAVRSILPKELQAYIDREGYLKSDTAFPGVSIRLIPFAALGGTGLLPAIRADGVTVIGSSGKSVAEDVYIAFAKEKIRGGCDVIISPLLLYREAGSKGGKGREKKEQLNT